MSFTTERIIQEATQYHHEDGHLDLTVAPLLPLRLPLSHQYRTIEQVDWNTFPDPMDLLHPRVARFKGLDVNAEPFVPWKQIQAYYADKTWHRKGPQYLDRLDKYTELAYCIYYMRLNALAKHLPWS